MSNARTSRYLSLAAPIAALLALSVLASSPASAQQIVARVNGAPITAVDVAQRTRLLQLSNQGKAPSRKEVLDELIDEQLKLQAAQRYRIDIPETEIEQIVGSMAARMRASPQQFAQSLAAAGISIKALKRKLRADVAWNNIVRGKFQASLQVREKDIEVATQARGSGADVHANIYTLRPILLVVPRSGGAAMLETRRREAEALRSRFNGCEEGLRLVRGMRDVAVRQAIIRSAGDLSAKQREVVEATAVGKLTPPDITSSGVEVFAVCEKRQSKGFSGAARDAREQMMGERFTAQGKRYLRELRRHAAIEIR